MKAVFKRASPYADDALNLPVADVDAAIPYYEKIFGFRVVSKQDAPHRSALLARDSIQLGLAENGGGGTLAGCLFEVKWAGSRRSRLSDRPIRRHILQSLFRRRTGRIMLLPGGTAERLKKSVGRKHCVGSARPPLLFNFRFTSHKPLTSRSGRVRRL